MNREHTLLIGPTKEDMGTYNKYIHSDRKTRLSWKLKTEGVCQKIRILPTNKKRIFEKIFIKQNVDQKPYQHMWGYEIMERLHQSI